MNSRSKVSHSTECDTCTDHITTDHRRSSDRFTTDCQCQPRFAVCEGVQNLHPLPCPAILKCGFGSNPSFTGTPGAGDTTNPQPPQALANVTIDTTCQCFPAVKIEFFTIAKTNNNGAPVTFTLTLSKCCNNGCNNGFSNGFVGTRNGNCMTLQSFDFCIGAAPTNQDVCLPISFIFCEENAASANCTYFVDITAVGGLQNQNEKLSFERTTITALSVGCAREC